MAVKLMIRLALAILFSCILVGGLVPGQEPPTAATSSARVMGTVTAINGNTVSVKADSGSETSVTVPDSARIVRTAPGQKDLKSATPIRLQDIQVGDRVLARGQPAAAGNSITAMSLIVMKQSDVANRQQQELQEWQRRGTGGIVKEVDPNARSITVSVGPNQTVTVRTTASTQFLRYAPESVKFSDARKSSIDEIKPGDQLRARGARDPDGQRFTADAVISGSFRNIAGTVNSIDASAGTLTVMDVMQKKTAIVKITPETQMRKIPPDVAQRIAFFLKRPPPGGNGASQENAAGDGSARAQTARMAASPRTDSGQGAPDFQQVIRRMPPATLSELQKGDAVMIVTTQAPAGQPVTALNLLSGVEPILTAAPTETSAANLLSGWSMGGGAEGVNQ